MASVEIDESELMALRHHAGLADEPQAASRRQSRKSLLEDVTRPSPAPEPQPVAIANADNTDELAVFAPMMAEIQRLENRLAKAERSPARDAGYTDEGIAALTAFATARGIGDPVQAMREFERENPPGAPIMSGGGALAPWQARLGTASEMDRESEQISLKPLLEGNTEGFLSHAIAVALRDIRK